MIPVLVAVVFWDNLSDAIAVDVLRIGDRIVHTAGEFHYPEGMLESLVLHPG
jgi:hypothetical protein